MKRFIQLAMVLLLAMALLLVACDPKVDGHSSNFGSTGTGSGETGSGSDDPGTGSGETGSGSDDPETPHGEPIWHEEPITVDNAVAAIRAFFDDMEISEGGGSADIDPDKPILNLIGRPLSALGLDIDAFQAKLNVTEGNITATWAEDGTLELAETIASDGTVGDIYKLRGDYNMSQDTNGDWTISASRGDDDKWGFTGTLKKDNESGRFVSELKKKEDASNTFTTTFNSQVCAYNEVVLFCESEGFEDEAKISEKITRYFVDGNIPDGAKILETTVSVKNGEGEILYKLEESYTAGHHGGIHVANGLITEGESTQKARAWFPEEDGQLAIPDALKDLGIPDFTIKGCSFSTDVWRDMDDSPFSIFVCNDEPILFTVTETIDEVETKLAPKFKVSSHFEPKDADSPIERIYYRKSPDHTTLGIEFKEDASLDPFVALVD